MKEMLLDVQGQVTPICSKSHISYRFHVRKPKGKLWIGFAYQPKHLEDREIAKAIIDESIVRYTESDHLVMQQAKWETFLPLKNLITVSIDDPERHRGAAHRHDPEQLLVLSEHDASPGFLSGVLPAGLWEVTLSLHAIVTDSCRYSLQIWQEEE